MTGVQFKFTLKGVPYACQYRGMPSEEAVHSRTGIISVSGDEFL
jgi:hypothetical protein